MKLKSGLLFFGASKLAGLLKVSLLLGSHMAFLSARNMVTPLAGVFGKRGTATTLFAFSLVWRLLLGATVLAHCLPGYAAALYWAGPKKLIRLVLPALCMVLFIVHPVGGPAFAYAFYWLIPIGLYFVAERSFFLQALSSTFVAHAVGSVIWIYTVPMTSAMWLALIPVVIFERMIFASGIWAVYHSVNYIRQLALEGRVPFLQWALRSES